MADFPNLAPDILCLSLVTVPGFNQCPHRIQMPLPGFSLREEGFKEVGLKSKTKEILKNGFGWVFF